MLLSIVQHSINISSWPGPQQQTCSSGFAAVGPCWDRQTDGQTDGRPTDAQALLCIRDINEMSHFFRSRGKEFLDFRESRLIRPPDNRPSVNGIIVTGRSALASCFTAAVARIPDTRTPTPRNKGQQLSGRGQREQTFLPP